MIGMSQAFSTSIQPTVQAPGNQGVKSQKSVASTTLDAANRMHRNTTLPMRC